MTDRRTLKKQRSASTADAFRAAGFVRLPPWWVKPDELEVIYRMAHNHQSEINRIRAEARRRREPKEPQA